MEGFDGQNAWSFQPLVGPKLETGKELEEAKERSYFAEIGSYPKAETVGLEKAEGEECYKVLVTTNSGKMQTQHYSKKTGYLVKTTEMMMLGGTERQVEAIYKNYKKIGGFTYPARACRQ